MPIYSIHHARHRCARAQYAPHGPQPMHIYMHTHLPLALPGVCRRPALAARAREVAEVTADVPAADALPRLATVAVGGRRARDDGISMRSVQMPCAAIEPEHPRGAHIVVVVRVEVVVVEVAVAPAALACRPLLLLCRELAPLGRAHVRAVDCTRTSRALRLTVGHQALQLGERRLELCISLDLARRRLQHDHVVVAHVHHPLRPSSTLAAAAAGGVPEVGGGAAAGGRRSADDTAPGERSSRSRSASALGSGGSSSSSSASSSPSAAPSAPAPARAALAAVPTTVRFGSRTATSTPSYGASSTTTS
eukprot:scaffold5308_cov70-Phaeocystis_antarctica.AAC.9